MSESCLRVLINSSTTPRGTNASSTDPLQVAVIGGGIAGLCMGIKLLERGIDEFLILEKSADIGGTWHDNSYPGACCDVPAVLYSYSFAPNPDWTRLFPSHGEIKAYLKDCAERFGLMPKLRLNCAVQRADWREEAGQWELTLADGRCIRARALVSALGQLNLPQVPDFPGRERFAGHSFHSARWDHQAELAGKRVAVIGSAASALQFIPHLAREVSQLYVYQRSANYVIKRGDRPYSERERRRFRRYPLLQKLRRLAVYLRGEWVFYPVLRNHSGWLLKLWEKWCRDHLEEMIKSPELRRKLTPDYRLGCKRILISDDYFQAYNRANVELVTSPIVGLDEQGVVTEDEKARPVDVLIYGTGFDTSAMHAAVDYRGVDGCSLRESWSSGAEAYRGVCVSGFPNLFLLYGPNTNLGSNSIIFMIERQVAWAVNCIDKLLTHRLRALDVNRSVLRRYNDRMQGELAKTVWVANCQSWYKNAAGKVINNWPRSTLAYWWHMRNPDFTDFDMRQ